MLVIQGTGSSADEFVFKNASKESVFKMRNSHAFQAGEINKIKMQKVVAR